MNTQVIFREYRDADYGALAEVIRETWNYDRFCSPKTAASIARVYLDSCLIQQTFTRVAEMDGIPVGVIMGKDIAHHRCPFSLRLKWLRSVAALALSSEGRKVSRIFAHVEKMDQELLAACGRHYGGELAFFAVGKHCRGEGIGRALFQAVAEDMASRGISDFYLFTDTSCNYRFYEHMGMTRRGEKRCTMVVNGQEEEMTFFLYDNLP